MPKRSAVGGSSARPITNSTLGPGTAIRTNEATEYPTPASIRAQPVNAGLFQLAAPHNKLDRSPGMPINTMRNL